jgi:SAM-dependent methyltransferase
MTDQQQHQQWSQFWRQGHITTFGPALPENYDGMLREFWTEQFSRADSGTRILDIATGNGALATMAAKVSEEHDLGLLIHASDIAEINPALNNEALSKLRQQITFLSNTPCHKQPFPDHNFEMITSQFGFEYSDVPATLEEILRLLADGGRFIAIAHHGESNIIQGARDELQVYHAALKEFDVFGRLAQFFATLEDTPGSADQRRPLGERLNEAVNGLNKTHGSSPCAQQILGAITHLAKGANAASGPQRMNAVKAAHLDFSMAQHRLLDMVAAGLDEDDVALLRDSATAVGFTEVLVEEYRVEDSSLAGWQVQLTRN